MTKICGSCGHINPDNETDCIDCGHALPTGGAGGGPTPPAGSFSCISCHQVVPGGTTVCPFCGTALTPSHPPGGGGGGGGGGGFERRIRNRLPEIIIITILAIVSFLFGAWFLGIGLFLWFIHDAIPKSKNVDNGALIIRAAMKTASLGLMSFQFLFYPILGSSALVFLAVIIALIGYFSFAGMYRENDKISDPYRVIEARFFKFVMGVILAIVVWIAFTEVGWGIAALIIAFFCYFGTKYDPKQTFLENIFTAEGVFGTLTGLVNLIIYIIFLIIGGIGLLTYMGGVGSVNVMMGLVFLLMAILGIFLKPEARPYLGIAVIMVAVIGFSVSYTGVIGSQLFGPIWPQVQSSVVTPLTDTFGMAYSTFEETLELVTCPSCYLARQAQESRAKSQVAPGGTVYAIESKIELLGNPSLIDPQFPLVGTIELENRGEFTANGLKVHLNDLKRIDPEAKTGEEEKDTNIYGEFTSCGDVSSSGSDCIWTGEIVQGDIKYLTFKYENMGALDDTETEPEEGIIAEITGDKKSATKYVYGGHTIILPITYTYGYDASVSLPVEIMDSELLTEKLKNREVTLQEKISQYQGGPAKLSLWVQKQPLRSGDTVIGQVSVENQLNGKILEVLEGGAKSVFYFYVPADKFDITTYSQIGNSYMDCKKPPGAELSGDYVDYYKFTCTLDEDLGKGKLAFVNFEIKTEVLDVEQTSAILVGEFDYFYKGEKDIQMPLAMIPYQGA